MIGAWRSILWSAAALVVVAAQGCATGPAKQEVTSTTVISARSAVPEDRLLDVGVHVLQTPNAQSAAKGGAAGTSAEESDSKDGGASNPEIQAAEARYIPFHLKQTLQRTGYWGAVRVVPDRSEDVDVSVKGRLLESNGETLRLQFQVTDVTGRVWFDNEYSAVATKKSYASLKEKDYDPYQDLYNRVANDMLAYLQKLGTPEIAEIRRVSMLKFANSIAPYAFAGYLVQDSSGITHVSRLPAANDPMYQRVQRIRAREYMFIDTVNQYYGNLYDDMRGPYGQWRRSYLEELDQQRALERKAWERRILGVAAIVGAVLLGTHYGGTGAADVASAVMVIGGVEAIRSGSQYADDAKIHADTIKELGASFKGDVAPIVDEVEGRTVKLSGSVDTQYAEWRRTLREMFVAETGQSPEPAAAAKEASGTSASGR
ncbi:MAG: hypothetical protein WCE38_24050 [Burkholderiales bacterium]